MQRFVLIVGALCLTSPAVAKGPGCFIELEALHFAHDVLPVGHRIEARIEGRLVADDGAPMHAEHEGYAWCRQALVDQTRVYATEPETAQFIELRMRFDPDGMVLVGDVDPLQAGGTYVIDDDNGLFGAPRPAPRFEVEGNPDADTEPPELLGFTIAPTHIKTFDVVGVQVDVRDEAGIEHLLVVYLDDEGFGNHQRLQCDPVLNRCASTDYNLNFTRVARWRLARISMTDRLGNQVALEDHPAFADVMVVVTRYRNGEPYGRVERRVDPDEPAAVDEMKPPEEDEAEPPPVDEMAPPAMTETEPASDDRQPSAVGGCSTTPMSDAPSPAGWLLVIASLLAIGRRDRSSV